MLEIGSKNNILEFKLEVENTTMDQITSRLIVEVDDNITLIPLYTAFDGMVKGSIPLKEEWEGKGGYIKLEVINENNYFIPFEKPVVFRNIESSIKTSVKSVKTQPQPTPTPKVYSKPILETKKTTPSKSSKEDLSSEIKNFFKTL